MKKLILTIIFLIGIYSFPIEITGPRYKIDGTLGIGYKPDPNNKKKDGNNLPGN
ncbi:hypothetical protein [Streptobacillus moniliformis]|uniref:hypothetical protein n=1 Tax=Streptobacillus moniliformis TaxID=34105 RepID=UPI000A509318|nr:hypothetical protein [Streptobacillus moniliformis]